MLLLPATQSLYYVSHVAGRLKRNYRNELVYWNRSDRGSQGSLIF